MFQRNISSSVKHSVDSLSSHREAAFAGVQYLILIYVKRVIKHWFEMKMIFKVIGDKCIDVMQN